MDRSKMMSLMPAKGNFKASGRRPNIRVYQDCNSLYESSDVTTSIIAAKKAYRGIVQTTAKFKKHVVQLSSSDEDDAKTSVNFNDCNSYKSSRSEKSEVPTVIDELAAIVLKAKEFKQQDSFNVPFYKGQHIHLQQDSLKKDLKYGPQRVSQSSRATTQWDYAPDICKDYKETAFCGFGDSCKFLHDRSDFGWKVEEDDFSMDYENKFLINEEEACQRVILSFECSHCGGNTFKELLRSRCKHLFCDSCFKDASKERRCPSCSFGMDGFGKIVTSSKWTGIRVSLFSQACS